jgi:GTP-binding protein
MEPQLGIVAYRGSRSFVMADIPGIIEGASEGRGLGLRFLRHIERNAVLLFMVPADADNIAEQYSILLREVEQFNPQLADKPRLLAISKSDMLDQELIDEIEATLPTDLPHVFISAVSGLGIDDLKDMLWSAINDENNRIEPQPITHRPLDMHHRVREEDEFIFEQTPIQDDEEEEFDEDWDEMEWEYNPDDDQPEK